jgi:uncharacterized membrane protein
MKNSEKNRHPEILTQLLQTNNESLRKLHDIVASTMQEEALIVQNLMNPPAESLTRGQRVSDKVARFGGSWAFISSFCILLFPGFCTTVWCPHTINLIPFPSF